MSALVLDAIDRQIAELERVTTAPTGPLGYGRDLSCVDDITPELAEVDPRSTRGIGEAAIRRLMTPRGGLPDDPDYGLDLRALLNRGVADREAREIAGRIRLEVAKDDRIDDLAVAVTMPAPSTLRIEARITPADPDLTPFSLVLAVTSAGVLLEALA